MKPCPVKIELMFFLNKSMEKTKKKHLKLVLKILNILQFEPVN